MCDVSNAKDIVEELLQVYNHLTLSYIQFFCIFLFNVFGYLLYGMKMLKKVKRKYATNFMSFQYLSTAEFVMREELSLKIAILAEKFAPDLSWYEIDMEQKMHVVFMYYVKSHLRDFFIQRSRVFVEYSDLDVSANCVSLLVYDVMTSKSVFLFHMQVCRCHPSIN